VTQIPLSMLKDQGHQAALLNKALTHQAAASVSVGTYCYVAACSRGCTPRSVGLERFSSHRGKRGAGHIVAAACLQLVSIYRSARGDVIYSNPTCTCIFYVQLLPKPVFSHPSCLIYLCSTVSSNCN